MSRLAVISTHPIQYYAPLFRELAEGEAVNVHVFYGWTGPSEGAYDPGFDADVTWDVPLLDGYPYSFVENLSDDPGTHHLRGLVNPSLVSDVRAWGPDAVLVFGWNYWSHLQALRAFSGEVPVYFRGDSTLIDESPGVRRWMRRMWLRWVYRYVDTALYVGAHNRAYFEAHGLSDDQLAWVPHAVDNTRFADPPFDADAEAAEWRQDLGIPEDASAVVFAGKLSSKKAPGVLIDAFQRLDRRDAHLILAGSGPLEGALRRKVSEDDPIHFLGFQNQSRMPTVYRLGDVFVLPSRGPGETWGLAINEAMACSRAVVASTKVGCAPDLIEPGENGFVFDVDDPSSLASCLRPLLRNRSRCRSMGEVSRERIRDWSISAAARRLEDAVV